MRLEEPPGSSRDAEKVLDLEVMFSKRCQSEVNLIKMGEGKERTSSAAQHPGEPTSCCRHL